MYVREKSPTLSKYPLLKMASNTSSIRTYSTNESNDSYVRKKKHNQRGGQEQNEVDKYLVEDCEELLGRDLYNYFDLLGWW